VPVAPAINPWRLSMASGICTIGSGSHSPSESTAPSVMPLLALANAFFAASMISGRID